MIVESLRPLYQRDLDLLRKEVVAYSDESLIWQIDGQILNSAGNLCLHLCGNLQHFMGHLIGGSDYQRERDLEFSLKNVPRAELIRLIDQAEKAVNLGLDSLDEAILDKEFPLNVFGKPMTYAYFIIHLAGHLSYHLGQINYHRRLLSN